MVRVLLSALLLLSACPPVEELPGEPTPDACAADPWVPGQATFREATSDWGLEGLLAVRVSVTDLDGDGWPDLLLRNGGGPDEFGVEGGQNRFVMRNTGDGFEDVTEASGLFRGRLDGLPGSRSTELMMSGDADNDGDVDVWTGRNRENTADDTVETSELMLNDGTGVFTFAPDNLGFAGAFSVPIGATFADVDLDGVLDVFVANNQRGADSWPLQDRLFAGAGDGTFDDITLEAGLETGRWDNIARLNNAEGHSWGWSATACDLNNDGAVELLAASYGRAPNHLWQGTDGGGFVNASVASGYAFDHREDWTTNVNAQCFCFDNPAEEDCDLAPDPEDYGECESLFAAFGGYRWSHGSDREPWRMGGNSATTTCADLNNDGWLDLFTGEIVHWDVGDTSDPAEVAFNTQEDDVRLERPGNTELGFERDDPPTRWDHGDMNHAILDFDNDGKQDVYLSSSDYPGTRGWLYHQRADGTFERVSTEDGIDHLRSAGAAAVDIDRDGDLDLVVGHTLMRCGGSFPEDCYEGPIVRAFENLADGRNRWLQLRLEGGEGTNRSAVGARVTVERCGETLTRQVDGGHGIVGSQEDLTLHFGLGADEKADVTVHWPDAERSVERFTVGTDAAYSVRQGEGASPLD
jgi:enediyne biosynthesis protein E4